MNDREDKDLQNTQNMDSDDDFDYLKEIEAIEAQEKELEMQRQKKKAELERLHQEQEKEEHKTANQKKREVKERKKEAEWLGDNFDDGVETVEIPKKKKSRKGLIAIIVVILLIIAAGAAYAYKMQMDKKTVADFEQKVASFQSEKLDGVDFGTYEDYFNDFMKQCQEAVDAGDLKKISELNQKWSEIEETYTTVSNGKTSLDAFASGVNAALSTYYITDTYKEAYDALMKDIETARKDCDYAQVADLQKRLDSLATNLKADNMKTVQNLKNDIAGIDLDEDYTTDDQKKKMTEYSDKAEQYLQEENYAEAVRLLNEWKTEAAGISKVIADKKAEEAARAESEAEARRKAESKAQESRAAESRAAVESRAKAESESRKQETSKPSSGNTGGSGSSSSGDYVLPNSSSRYLTDSDVKNLSSYQLMIARNEIYARHGRKFNDKELQAYFNGKSWYKGTVEPEDFSVSVFNDYEIKNIQLIQSYE